VRNADPNANGLAEWYTYFHADTYGGSVSYAYGGRFSYAYSDASLHTELHIHVGDRNARAGYNAYRRCGL